jgi:hypothetical protein
LVHIATYVSPEQPGLGCFQYFPLHRTRAGNVKAWFDWCPCVATGRQYSCAGVIHHRGTATGSQGFADLPADVWEKTRAWSNYPKPEKYLIEAGFLKQKAQLSFSSTALHCLAGSMTR